MVQRHVRPAEPDGWQVVDPERNRVCVIAGTMEDAVQWARRALGSAGGGILVTEGADGSSPRSEAVPPKSYAPGTSFGPAGSTRHPAVE